MHGCEGERNNCGGDNALCWSENNMLAVCDCADCVRVCVCEVELCGCESVAGFVCKCVGYFEAAVRAAKAFQLLHLSEAQQDGALCR